jgi:hypothetical protein
MSMAIRSHKPAIATVPAGRDGCRSVSPRGSYSHGLIMISQATRVNSAPGGKGRFASRRRTSSAKQTCSHSVSGVISMRNVFRWVSAVRL